MKRQNRFIGKQEHYRRYRFKKPCRVCGKLFLPWSRTGELCESCLDKVRSKTKRSKGSFPFKVDKKKYNHLIRTTRV